jgi:hypothetical protein
LYFSTAKTRKRMPCQNNDLTKGGKRGKHKNDELFLGADYMGTENSILVDGAKNRHAIGWNFQSGLKK